MQETKRAPDVQQMGEYGASVITVTRDGSLTRLAFGRNSSFEPVYFLGVMISEEARLSLIEQLTGNDGPR